MRIKEGEIFYTNIKYQTFKHCAGGLKILAVIDDLPSGITQDECYKYRPVGSLTRVCSNCGNNNCEPWENICTCSEDCQ